MQIAVKGLLFRLNVKELEEYPVMVGVTAPKSDTSQGRINNASDYYRFHTKASCAHSDSHSLIHCIFTSLIDRHSLRHCISISSIDCHSLRHCIFISSTDRHSLRHCVFSSFIDRYI